MTTEIKELVKRLRERYSRRAAESNDEARLRRQLERDDAADALEAMAGEVERLTVAAKAADMFHAINGHGIKQAEELADHIIRQMLWGMRIDDSNKGIVRGYLLDHFKAVISRAEAAEAERDRLKAALDEAVKWMDGCAVSGGYPTWHAKARKALMGGDAS